MNRSDLVAMLEMAEQEVTCTWAPLSAETLTPIKEKTVVEATLDPASLQYCRDNGFVQPWSRREHREWAGVAKGYKLTKAGRIRLADMRMELEADPNPTILTAGGERSTPETSKKTGQVYTLGDLPKEYRDITWEPLTIAYLLDDPHCKWGFGGEDPNSLSNRLRDIPHVKTKGRGSPVAYSYKDLRGFVDKEDEDS